MSRARDSREVSGVLIPAGTADVLLPNAAVAEVTTFNDPTPLPSVPDWLLGTVTWRGCSVPLVSLARAGAEPTGSGHPRRSRVMICYTPSGNSALPYVGILASGPPRLVRLSAQVLKPAQIEPEHPFVLHGLIYAQRSAFIPDMDAIERALLVIRQGGFDGPSIPP